MKKVDGTKFTNPQYTGQRFNGPTVQSYIEHMLAYFKELRRVLCDDGVAVIDLPHGQVSLKKSEIPTTYQETVDTISRWNLFVSVPSPGVPQHLC